MTRNRKGRAGCNQATPKTSKRTRNLTGLVYRIEAVIVTLVLLGLLPMTVADRLFNLGGRRDV